MKPLSKKDLGFLEIAAACEWKAANEAGIQMMSSSEDYIRSYIKSAVAEYQITGRNPADEIRMKLKDDRFSSYYSEEISNEIQAAKEYDAAVEAGVVLNCTRDEYVRSAQLTASGGIINRLNRFKVN